MPVGVQSVPPSLAVGAGLGQSCGGFAADLIQLRLKQLVSLQADVLADRDPEPLHQMRVTCRRLRSTLEQFGAALLLPQEDASGRVGRVGRRLGLARDLDVLRLRLEQELMPLLPEKERTAVRKLLKQLRRERKHAFEAVEEALKGRRYLKLLAELQAWLRAPQFLALGSQPIGDWLPELRQVVMGDLLILPGWQVEQPYGTQGLAALHLLRRRLKRARYGLANLKALEPEQLPPWLDRLKAMQQTLGDLHDLQLLDEALHRQLDEAPDRVVPCLCSLLAEGRDRAWLNWQTLAAPLRTVAGRAAWHGLLVQAPPL